MAPQRNGFTLFELLLVLAILVVITAAAYPSIRRLMSERIVRQAAETLAVKFNATRVRAIENGIAYQFRVQAGGRQYCAAPAEAVDINRVNAVAGGAQSGVGSASAAAPSSSGSSGAGSTLATWRLLGELNTGVKIEAPVLQGSSPFALPIDVTTFSGRNDTAAYTETVWSEPIVIQPDGTSTTANIEVVGDNGWVYRISVRGLTGGTRVQSLGTRSKP